MLTSLQKFFKDLTSYSSRGKKEVRSPRHIRRLQIVWVILMGLGLLGVSYGLVRVVFDRGPKRTQESSSPQNPTLIETTSHKVDTNEIWRHKVEEDNKKITASLSSLKESVETSLQEMREQASSLTAPTHVTDSEDLQQRIQSLEAQLEQQSYRNNSESYASSSPSPSYMSEDGSNDRHLIQKVTLGLTDAQKKTTLKTFENTIPAGAFAKTVLLSGLDASASMSASSDPRPMLLRMIDPGTLPRKFQSDLKDCHCIASAYGDLSSERIYARLEKLTCVERKSGNIMETQVSGYISGSDGKAGIRGIVVSKDGHFLSRSLLGGLFAGLSNIANPQNRQAQVNPFFQGTPSKTGAQISPPNVGDMFASGMAQGASSALDRLSQYYIDRAEQLQPVIQVAAGQVVDIVFTEGAAFGSDQQSSNQ